MRMAPGLPLSGAPLKQIVPELARRMRTQPIALADHALPAHLLNAPDIGLAARRTQLRELGWVYTVPQRGTYVKQREQWPEG